MELEFLLRIVEQGIFENIEIAIILLKRIILFSRDLLFIFLFFFFKKLLRFFNFSFPIVERV